MPDQSEQLLITAADLRTRLERPGLRLLDCRFHLADPAAGRAQYLEAHVPGAVHVDLDRDLSAPVGSDRGRHPLPTVARMCGLFSRLGIDASVTVVVYDDLGGMFAARAWWMLRYLGHRAVKLLDGGWPQWVATGGPVARGAERAAAARFKPAVDPSRLVRLAAVPNDGLLDAREAERFRGEAEPIDPRAGHIPGARNHPWRDNYDAAGRFLPPSQLRDRLTRAAGAAPDANTVHYCGSGVSACVNIFAQVYAGLPEPRLYCGSFSEWCRDSSRRVIIAATGRRDGD